MTLINRSVPEKGMTLLEVLVAMVLVALIGLGTFTAFVFGRRAATDSNYRVMASKAAQETAEELRRAIRPDLGVGLPVDLTDGSNKDYPLPAGSPLAKAGGGRKYTVVHGKFNPDGTIRWDPNIADDSDGISDADHDISRVDITVEFPPF
ncbi:MAG: prepilin-type N-terminal cleavage/methylation domain-containing protein [Candidatus Omnitrophica bacterium]|nr:prepilin-type N-terminal cleavage/methylation domain-containing protein [Candidatus Omnitrophota bacterium]